ncbi:DNA replication protein [Serendipita sp. 411]|nr:DNA replication protein [Serendipita sp. 401]KAG8833389.1 DNA replication protein [Serendipita sp. 400]KAG8847881.1 DNA replication protein [Serendipita sp. 411]KAG9052997.1 DNA replication protein [Serendipita sp. 407]
MDNEYYSLEAILAENQKIECTFKLDIPGLGYLDNGADEDLKALTKLQLPYWLAPTVLYADWAEFNMPRPFNSLVQNALIAEARSVKIGALVGENGRWYTFGKMVVDLLNDPQAKELADILKLTLKGRLPDLMDQSQHFTGTASAAARSSGDEVGAEFRSGLDATERELFVLAQDSARLVKAWYESSDRVR